MTNIAVDAEVSRGNNVVNVYRYQLDVELPLGESITTRKKMWKEFATIETSKIE